MKTIPLLEPLADDLQKVERRLLEPVHVDYPHLTAVLQNLLGSGGKRLRPALALLAGGFYPTDEDKLVSLAASVEMLHTATLVHDDLIDGALMRRGSTTVNARWSMGATVLTGDYLFARAAALAAETDHVRVMAIFANTLMVICSGELRQIFDRHNLPRMGDQTAWQDALTRYDERINAKTASLFSAATEAAAVLGSAPEIEISALCEYGRLLGMGFQIIDDVLDFEGNQSVLGKPVGSDLREGIVTLPVLYFLRKNPNDDRIATVVQDGSDEELVLQVVDDIRASGAIAEALDRARSFIIRSQEHLSVLPDSEPRAIMHALADYTIARKR